MNERELAFLRLAKLQAECVAENIATILNGAADSTGTDDGAETSRSQALSGGGPKAVAPVIEPEGPAAPSSDYPEGEHGPCRLECGHEGTCWDGDHIWLREGDTYVIGDARDGARNAAWQELRRAAEEALIVMKQGPDREEFWHLSKALSAVSQGR